MVDVRRSPDADDDLVAVFEYGASKWGADAALQFVYAFEDAYAILAKHPAIGRERPEISSDMRSWLHQGYVLYYRIDADQIEIFRILHGAADAVPAGPWQ